MNKFVVVTFSDEAKAYEGVSAFKQLHNEGSITVYQTVVVKREADGKISTKQRTPAEDIGGGLGSVLGALVGAFGGPVGMTVGFVGGGAAGTLAGFTAGDLSEDLLEDVSKEMKPGMFAVLAEVSEPWTAAVDTRMQALGGKVLRENRRDLAESIIERRTQEQREWLDEKKSIRNTKKAQRMEANLDEEIADARRKLQRTAEKAKQRLEETKQEMNEKLATLQQQAAKAKPDVKKEIDERIARVRQEFAEREKKLTRAWDAAQEALQP